MKPSVTKQNVASHGDLWSNNLMFNRTDCRLVDFQQARYAPLSHDVAQFLYLTCSREFRESRASEMLRYYYESLNQCLRINATIANVKFPRWCDVELSYEEQKLGALVTAVMYYPTVLLDGTLGATIMNNPATYKQFVLNDRRGPVMENMKRDQQYRCRIEETVRELVQISERLDELHQPC